MNSMDLNFKGDTQFVKVLLDAIPSFIFAVDEDVCILEYNSAARELVNQDRAQVIKDRCGNVLHCLHALGNPAGCGRTQFCQDCTLRNAVNQAYQGQDIIRKKAKLDLFRNSKRISIYAMITAKCFAYQEKRFVLLIIEDISELVTLQEIIPICAKCKKVRNDDNYWMQVEAYFKDHLDVDFSHGLCPECFENEMEKLEQKFPGKIKR
jgi:hypothetical protein